jgi:hypothetical protein
MVAGENGEENTMINTDMAAGMKKVQLLPNKCKKRTGSGRFFFEAEKRRKGEGEKIINPNFGFKVPYL